jgi:formate hydrogenlyase subunit 6/NADH:ubiquinone oxidoreductase subunit I
MKYPKIREIKEAVKALLTRPYTTQFPHAPHVPCLSFRGRPYFNEEDCVGCGACVNVCPTGALSFKDIQTDAGYKRVLKVRWDVCIECGQCELNCLTEKGIELSNEFDIATTEQRNIPTFLSSTLSGPWEV